MAVSHVTCPREGALVLGLLHPLPEKPRCHVTPDTHSIQIICDNGLFFEFADLLFVAVAIEVVISYFWKPHSTVAETAWEDGDQETWVLFLAVSVPDYLVSGLASPISN